MLKKIVIFIVVFSFFGGCVEKKPFTKQKDLLGDWKALNINISSTESAESISFPMDKYGYGNITFNNDGTFTLLLKLMQDLVLEKEIFGNPYRKVILHNGFTDFKKGYYSVENKIITFSDLNQRVVLQYNYYFQNQELFTKFMDNENKQWIISWEK